MKKIDLLFQMLDNPEHYSEAQWQEILADDECRELYELMAKTKSAAQPTQVTNEEIDTEWQRLVPSKQHQSAVIPLWRKIAAAAAIMIALFGFTFAAVRTGFFGMTKSSQLTEASQSDNVVNKESGTAEGEGQLCDTLAVMQPRLYDNVPLEQILNELSTYYKVDVEYRSEDVRSLRLYYQWEPDYSLERVVEMLSHFETFNIHQEGNKLVVEASTKGGEQ